ncbi:MAG: thioredoxin family protein [Methanothrix sp.]|nr:thioredoxin family protein [Methanothrix sp.]
MMMTSITGKTGKSTILALAILCLLTLAMIGDCRAAPQEQADGNGSVPEQIYPDAPIILNDDGIDEAIMSYPDLVIDCWEIGCPPCKLMDPNIDRMAEDYKGRIVFAKLCIDRNPISMARYRISRTPTLLIFRNGTLVADQVGNYPQEDLERMILAALQMQ